MINKFSVDEIGLMFVIVIVLIITVLIAINVGARLC